MLDRCVLVLRGLADMCVNMWRGCFALVWALCFWGLVLEHAWALPATPPLDKAALRALLGWVPAALSTDPLCPGHFLPLTTHLSLSKAASQSKPGAVLLTADRYLITTAAGAACLAGHVTIRQQDRVVQAERAQVQHDRATGRLRQIQLQDNVRIGTPTQALFAQVATLFYPSRTAILKQVYYRLQSGDKAQAQVSWGHAKQVQQQADGKLNLTQATYSTCAPGILGWSLSASVLSLDSTAKEAQARHVALYLGHVPIFYWPYLNFSTDKHHRESGFLAPSVGYSKQRGGFVRWPWYWNLAPNYDVLLTPRWQRDRGGSLALSARYLGQHSRAALTGHWLPNDRAFHRLRVSAAASLLEPIESAQQRLVSASDMRGVVAGSVDYSWQPTGALHGQLQYASDDYLLLDGLAPSALEQFRHLSSELAIRDQHADWSWSVRVLHYQTLTPWQQAVVAAPYDELPALTLHHALSLPGDVELQSTASVTRFRRGHADSASFTADRTQGDRMRWSLRLQRWFGRSYGYVRPELGLDALRYAVRSPQSVHLGRVFPMLNLDSALYFEQHPSATKSNARQVIWAPRLNYQYVPYRPQADLPVFDTYLPPLYAAQVFHLNRFMGGDRVGDAHQIAVSMTRRVTGLAGDLQGLATLARVYYLNHPQVCLFGQCSQLSGDGHWSPWLMHLEQTVGRGLSIQGDAVWQSGVHRLDNAAMTLAYRRGAGRQLQAGYYFVRAGDSLATQPAAHLNRLQIAMAWPITSRWQGLASGHYNLVDRRFEQYFAGIGYQQCCYALRFVGAQRYRGLSAVGRRQYERRYYVQLELKGLTTLSNRKPTALLKRNLPGLGLSSDT